MALFPFILGVTTWGLIASVLQTTYLFFAILLPNLFKLYSMLLWSFINFQGLNLTRIKSGIYIDGIDDQGKAELCNLLGFQLGSLLVKYEEVPLISTKLSTVDCKGSIERKKKYL